MCFHIRTEFLPEIPGYGLGDTALLKNKKEEADAY